MQSDLSPMVQLIRRASLTRLDVAHRARVSIPTIDKMCRDGDHVFKMQLGTLLSVSIALGCALCELYPILAQRPDRGLLWERRVFTTPRKKVAQPLKSQRDTDDPLNMDSPVA